VILLKGGAAIIKHYEVERCCEGCGAVLTVNDWPYGFRVANLCNICKGKAEVILSTPEKRQHEKAI